MAHIIVAVDKGAFSRVRSTSLTSETYGTRSQSKARNNRLGFTLAARKDQTMAQHCCVGYTVLFWLHVRMKPLDVSPGEGRR